MTRVRYAMRGIRPVVTTRRAARAPAVLPASRASLEACHLANFLRLRCRSALYNLLGPRLMPKSAAAPWFLTWRPAALREQVISAARARSEARTEDFPKGGGRPWKTSPNN